MSDFKIGEILIGQNHVMTTDRNGMECEIIGALEMRAGRIGGVGPIETSLAYRVRWADGKEWGAKPVHLRRRKPPAADSHERTYMQMWRDMASKAPQREGVPA